jgi:glutathione S-transferase
MKLPVLFDGTTRIWESLAILEYLAETRPHVRLWPDDIEARATARSVSAEMHAGFLYLRERMFFNCRSRFPGKGRGPGVDDDINRICTIWRDCRENHGAGGDFLFGEFTIADAMFAPVVVRFRTYAVELDAVSRAYAEAMLGLSAVRDWLAGARAEPWTIREFEYA